MPEVATVAKVIAFYQVNCCLCYEEWILPLRRFLHVRVVNTLENAILGLEVRRARTGPAAAGHLRDLDPLHEANYRHLMRLCALNNDRAGALRVYHEYVRCLNRN